MKRPVLLSAIAALLVAVASISWAATNFNLSRSNVYLEFPGAQVVTATISLSGPNQTQTVYTVPATGDFILTQLCASPVSNGGIRLGISGFGYIAQTQDAALCYTFTPGVSVPQGSALTCSTTTSGPPFGFGPNSGNYFCTISGTFTPPVPAPTPNATPTATPAPPA